MNSNDENGEKPADKKNGGEGINRRTFVGVAGVASLGAASAAQAGAFALFLRPRVLYEPSNVYPIGSADQYPMGEATFRDKERLYVFNDMDGMYSISSVCTHLGCNVRYRKDAGFLCPCHGSTFKPNGEVKSGPAPRPLPWYRVRLSRKGVLMVDKGSQVEPGFRLRLG